MVQILYDVITEHWAPKPNHKKRSLEGLEPNVDKSGGDSSEPTGEEAQECEAPCIQDDYGEACLAENLGVELMAQEVIPATQPFDGEGETLTQGFGEVEPVALFQNSQVADTEVDESTPKQSEVIEVLDSQPTVITFTSGAMTTVLTDPMPSKKKYTQEDLKTLRAKIEKVKCLN